MDIGWLCRWKEEDPVFRTWVVRGCVGGGYRVQLARYKGTIKAMSVDSSIVEEGELQVSLDTAQHRWENGDWRQG